MNSFFELLLALIRSPHFIVVTVLMILVVSIILAVANISPSTPKKTKHRLRPRRKRVETVPQVTNDEAKEDEEEV
ncbi:hypothetical protein [Sediminispirochaeta smaragdinae]|jgi:hypothetical protein|uniref:Uncharacterized protein n=1 Tax=Sediminispirochaeta smaragdinae (strain DSM 11293 / JCM 15392 / SEBR 4228) TaxID=573413 RepID=E1R3E7_SEDSS|nr:hypothetical protein [Sediminispirochaeta smaragdinae]ADK81578.1 hypothetical protein Spirs_2464 [Sediminispirochaeta smaragdinae DSM 11293]